MSAGKCHSTALVSWLLLMGWSGRWQQPWDPDMQAAIVQGPLQGVQGRSRAMWTIRPASVTRMTGVSVSALCSEGCTTIVERRFEPCLHWISTKANGRLYCAGASPAAPARPAARTCCSGTQQLICGILPVPHKHPGKALPRSYKLAPSAQLPHPHELSMGLRP